MYKYFDYKNYAQTLMLIICKSLQYEQIRSVKFDKNISIIYFSTETLLLTKEFWVNNHKECVF